MDNNQQTSHKDDLRAIRIFCITLIAGVIVFATVIILLVNFKTGPVLDPVRISKLGDIFLAFSAVLALTCLFFATKKYGKSIAHVREKLTLADKLSEYKKVLTFYMATCEAPAIFGIIGFFMTGNYIMLAISAFMLGTMLGKAPLGKKYMSELNLNWQEQQELV